MREVIQSCVNVPDEMYRYFQNIATKKVATRGTCIFYPEKQYQKIFFIEQGMMRGYKIIEGKDYTHHFYTEQWFATDFENYLTGQTSSLYIEAMSEVTYFEFQKKDLQLLYETFHPFEKLGRIIAERAYLATVEKLKDIQTLDLKSRYWNLIEKNPRLFQRVPQKYIASYLGVTEQSLSRIKRSFIS